MRAREAEVDPGVGAEVGVEHGVVGIGDSSTRRQERFGAVPDGTFVWTRTPDGRYRLGRIAGPLRAADGRAASEAALTHIRDADWLDRPFGEDEVPAAVAATFARGGRNFQRTHSEIAERRTTELWKAHR